MVPWAPCRSQFWSLLPALCLLPYAFCCFDAPSLASFFRLSIFSPAVINQALSTKTTKGQARQEQQSAAGAVIPVHIGTESGKIEFN